MDEPWPLVPDETPIDPSGLIDRRGIRNRAELNVAEAQNLRVALVKYLSRKPTSRSAPFDYGWFLKLHREMFGDVWSWAGNARQVDLSLGIPWQQIPEQLEQLVGNLHEWNGFGWPLLEQAAHLHHAAVRIHPFLGGNGRWSRLLANIWLKKHGRAIVLWPEDTIGGTSTVRSEYIAAIQEADRGNYTPLLNLQAGFVESV